MIANVIKADEVKNFEIVVQKAPYHYFVELPLVIKKPYGQSGYRRFAIRHRFSDSWGELLLNVECYTSGQNMFVDIPERCTCYHYVKRGKDWHERDSRCDWDESRAPAIARKGSLEARAFDALMELPPPPEDPKDRLFQSFIEPFGI